MKRVLGAVITGGLALSAGCGSQPGRQAEGTPVVPRLTASPAPTTSPSLDVAPAAPGATSASDAASSDGRVIARINGEPVTMGELMKPLLESHGLQILTGIVQLDLLKQEARQDHTTVTADDIRQERESTLGKMFKDADTKEEDQLDAAEARGDKESAAKLREQIDVDREALLSQYLDNQHFSRAEFDLKIEINTYLHKKAERLLQGKITDEMVEKEFGIEYGETRDVRYIQLANMQQVAKAREQLAQEKSFADVAKDMTLNPRMRDLGGLVPGISRQTPGLPEVFKDKAFALEPGQVAPDTLNLGGYFYILKVDAVHPPRAVKFESVKDSLRKSMYDRLATSLMAKLGESVGREAELKMQVEDPILKAQYDEFIARQQKQAIDRQKLEKQLDKERAAQPAATQPTAGALGPAPAPAAVPPATQP